MFNVLVRKNVAIFKHYDYGVPKSQVMGGKIVITINEHEFAPNLVGVKGIAMAEIWLIFWGVDNNFISDLSHQRKQ